MLNFKLILQGPGAPDVVSRKLVLQIGTGAPNNFELPGDALESAEFMGADNDPVVGSLTDVDDAGNESEARSFSFVLTDTIAPPQPGEIGIVITGEE